MSTPRITVITPVYNRPEHLVRALASVARQTLEDFECLVIDDASDESPIDVVNDLNDSRFRLIKRETNGGCTAARMFGLRYAAGEYIANLDSDNEFYPWTLERAVKLLATSPSHVGCVTGLYVFPDGLRMRVPDGPRFMTPAQFRQTSIRSRSDGVGVVRRSVVDDWLSRRDDFYNLDFHLVFWMLLRHGQMYVDEPWGVYHTDASNRVTTNPDPREFQDVSKFVEEYRPLLGTDPCEPLDEYLRVWWCRLRRARRTEEVKIVEEWMRERGITRRQALMDWARLRMRTLLPRSSNVDLAL